MLYKADFILTRLILLKQSAIYIYISWNYDEWRWWLRNLFILPHQWLLSVTARHIVLNHFDECNTWLNVINGQKPHFFKYDTVSKKQTLVWHFVDFSNSSNISLFYSIKVVYFVAVETLPGLSYWGMCY